MKYFISVILFLLFLAASVQSQEIDITNPNILPRKPVYEGTFVYLTVNVTSSIKVSNVYAVYSNYSLNLVKKFTMNASLTLTFGNQTSGIWYYGFKVPEGIYTIDSITATDVNKNLTTIYTDHLEFRVYKNVTQPNITNECDASISLGRTQFNSSENVNYTIRLTNNGIALMNPNASVVGPMQVSVKPIDNFIIDTDESKDISFNFTTPNVSNDTSLSFFLYINSNDCTFTFPFQFLIKKFQPNGTTVPNTTNNTNQTNGHGFWDIPIFNWKLPFDIPEITIPGGQKITGIGLVILIVILIVLFVFVLFMVKEIIKFMPKKKPTEETEESQEKRGFLKE